MVKNIFAIILSVLLLSSCVEDDYWVTGYLDDSYVSYTLGNGYYDAGGIYYIGDIDGVNYARETIEEIRLLGAQIEISGNFRRGDRIVGLIVDVDKVGKFEFPQINILAENDIIILDTRKYEGFYRLMYDAIARLNFTNNFDILISGFLYDSRSSAVYDARINTVLKTTIDVRVSD